MPVDATSPLTSSYRDRQKPPRNSRDRSRSPRAPRNHDYQQRIVRDKHVREGHQRVALLPYGATPLTKHDLKKYRTVFARYLDIQKGLDIDALTEHEVRGRWKSFVGKWNHSKLANGWYDPETFERSASLVTSNTYTEIGDLGDSEYESDDQYGPALPSDNTISVKYNLQNARQQGPGIPSFEDSRTRDELLKEEDAAAQREQKHLIRNLRKADQTYQKELLDELVPRAEAGTRERQLEKKHELAASNKAFATSHEIGGDVDLADRDVMGDEDSLGDLKKTKASRERKKNEREIRREEALRARMAEREERMRELREKEEKTIRDLRALAEARFGKAARDTV